MRPSLKTRIASVVTLFFFAFTNLAPSGFAGIHFSPAEKVPVSKLELLLPPELGRVEDTHISAEGSPVVFHIEAAHGDAGIQKKIKEILRYLHETQRVQLVFAEGAAEKLEPELLRFFPDRSLNDQMAELLLEKGLYTGMDLFLLDPASKDIEAVGIEKSRLYRAAYQAFSKVLQDSPAVETFLREKQMRLDRQAQTVLSKNLMELVRKHQKFEDHQFSFIAYSNFLLDAAKQFLKIDFKTPFLQLDWPQLVRLALVQQFEKELNREKLAEEKKKMDSTFGVLNVAEGESPRSFFERYLHKVLPRGFRFSDYPHFSRRVGQQILQSELDARTLSAEVEKLRKMLEGSLERTEKDRLILKKYEELLLLKKLLRLELSREEWDSIRDRVKVGKGFPSVMTSALRFYRLVERRDQVFFDTLRQEMKARGEKKALLVTGGFHTEGLTQLFRQNGFSYAVVSPHVSEEVNTDVYRKAMVELAQMEITEVAQRAEVRAAQGRRLKIEKEWVQNAFKEIASKSGIENWHSALRQTPYWQDLVSFSSRPSPRAEVRSDDERGRAIRGFEKKLGTPGRLEWPAGEYFGKVEAGLFFMPHPLFSSYFDLYIVPSEKWKKTSEGKLRFPELEITESEENYVGLPQHKFPGAIGRIRLRFESVRIPGAQERAPLVYLTEIQSSPFLKNVEAMVRENGHRQSGEKFARWATPAVEQVREIVESMGGVLLASSPEQINAAYGERIGPSALESHYAKPFQIQKEGRPLWSKFQLHQSLYDYWLGPEDNLPPAPSAVTLYDPSHIMWVSTQSLDKMRKIFPSAILLLFDPSSLSRAEVRSREDLLGTRDLIVKPKTYLDITSEMKIKVQYGQKLSEMTDPRKWEFRNQEQRDYAVRISQMTLTELDAEAKRYYNWSFGIDQGLDLIIQDPYHAHLGHVVNDPEAVIFMREDAKQSMPEFYERDKERYEQEVKGAEKEIALVREILYRWDSSPKGRSYLLFSDKGKVLQSRKEKILAKIIELEWSIASMNSKEDPERFQSTIQNLESRIQKLKIRLDEISRRAEVRSSTEDERAEQEFQLTFIDAFDQLDLNQPEDIFLLRYFQSLLEQMATSIPIVTDWMSGRSYEVARLIQAAEKAGTDREAFVALQELFSLRDSESGSVIAFPQIVGYFAHLDNVHVLKSGELDYARLFLHPDREHWLKDKLTAAFQDLQSKKFKDRQRGFLSLEHVAFLGFSELIRERVKGLRAEWKLNQIIESEPAYYSELVVMANTLLKRIRTIERRTGRSRAEVRAETSVAQEWVRLLTQDLDHFDDPESAWSKALKDAMGYLLWSVRFSGDSFPKWYLKVPRFPDDLTQDDILAIGEGVTRYWRNRGWDVSDFHYKTIFLPQSSSSSAQDYRAAEQKKILLERGNLEELLVRDWLNGVSQAVNLRWVGVHLEEKGQRPVDNELHVDTVRRFIPLLLTWRKTSHSELPPLKPGYQGVPPGVTIDDLMLWGLTVMLDPIIHDTDVKKFYTGQAAMVAMMEIWKGLGRESVPEYLRRMLVDIKQVDADGNSMERIIPREEIEALLTEALSRGTQDWDRLGFRSPWTFVVASMRDYEPILKRESVKLPFRTPPLNLVFRFSSAFDREARERHGTWRDKDVEWHFVSKYYDRELAQKEIFLKAPVIKEILPGLEMRLIKRMSPRKLRRVNNYLERKNILELLFLLNRNLWIIQGSYSPDGINRYKYYDKAVLRFRGSSGGFTSFWGYGDGEPDPEVIFKLDRKELAEFKRITGDIINDRIRLGKLQDVRTHHPGDEERMRELASQLGISITSRAEVRTDEDEKYPKETGTLDVLKKETARYLSQIQLSMKEKPWEVYAVGSVKGNALEEIHGGFNWMVKLLRKGYEKAQENPTDSQKWELVHRAAKETAMILKALSDLKSGRIKFANEQELRKGTGKSRWSSGFEWEEKKDYDVLESAHWSTEEDSPARFEFSIFYPKAENLGKATIEDKKAAQILIELRTRNRRRPAAVFVPPRGVQQLLDFREQPVPYNQPFFVLNVLGKEKDTFIDFAKNLHDGFRIFERAEVRSPEALAGPSLFKHVRTTFGDMFRKYRMHASKSEKKLRLTVKFTTLTHLINFSIVSILIFGKFGVYQILAFGAFSAYLFLVTGLPSVFSFLHYWNRTFVAPDGSLRREYISLSDQKKILRWINESHHFFYSELALLNEQNSFAFELAKKYPEMILKNLRNLDLQNIGLRNYLTDMAYRAYSGNPNLQPGENFSVNPGRIRGRLVGLFDLWESSLTPRAEVRTYKYWMWPSLRRMMSPDKFLGEISRSFFKASLMAGAVGGWISTRTMLYSFGGNIVRFVKSLSSDRRILPSLFDRLAISRSEEPEITRSASWPKERRNFRMITGTSSSIKNFTEEAGLTLRRGYILDSSRTVLQSEGQLGHDRGLDQGNNPSQQSPRVLSRPRGVPTPHKLEPASSENKVYHAGSRNQLKYISQEGYPFRFSPFGTPKSSITHLSGQAVSSGSRAEVRAGEKNLPNRRDFLRLGGAGAAKAAGIALSANPQELGLSSRQISDFSRLLQIYDQWPQKGFWIDYYSSPSSEGFNPKEIASLKEKVQEAFAHLPEDNPLKKKLGEKENVFRQALERAVQNRDKSRNPRNPEDAKEIFLALHDPAHYPLWRQVREMNSRLQSLTHIKKPNDLSEFERAKKAGLNPETYLQNALTLHLRPYAAIEAKKTAARLRQVGVPFDAQTATEDYIQRVAAHVKGPSYYYQQGYSVNDYIGNAEASSRWSAWLRFREKVEKRLKARFGKDARFPKVSYYSLRGEFDPRKVSREYLHKSYEASLHRRYERIADKILRQQRKQGASLSPDEIKEELEKLKTLPVRELRKTKIQDYAQRLKEKYPARSFAQRLKDDLAVVKLPKPRTPNSFTGELAEWLARAARQDSVQLWIHTDEKSRLYAVHWKGRRPYDRPPFLSREELDRLETAWDRYSLQSGRKYVIEIPRGVSPPAVENFLTEKTWHQYPLTIPTRGIVQVNYSWPIELPARAEVRMEGTILLDFPKKGEGQTLKKILEASIASIPADDPSFDPIHFVEAVFKGAGAGREIPLAAEDLNYKLGRGTLKVVYDRDVAISREYAESARRRTPAPRAEEGKKKPKSAVKKAPQRVKKPLIITEEPSSRKRKGRVKVVIERQDVTKSTPVLHFEIEFTPAPKPGKRSVTHRIQFPAVDAKHLAETLNELYEPKVFLSSFEGRDILLLLLAGEKIQKVSIWDLESLKRFLRKTLPQPDAAHLDRFLQSRAEVRSRATQEQGGTVYQWDTPERGMASVRDGIQKNRPDIVNRYDRLTSLAPLEREVLKNDIYKITQGHFNLWGLSSAVHQKYAPYFQGSYIDALISIFPHLNLHPLGFRLDWTTKEKAVESIRFVLSREAPTLIERYNRHDQLSSFEINALKRDIYRTTDGYLKVWGLSQIGDRKSTPYFNGSFINALTATFPELHLDPLGFQLNWSSEQTGIASVRFVLSREAPDLLERYNRLDQLSAVEKEALKNEIYRISFGHFKVWEITGALRRTNAPYFEGSIAKTLMTIFPRLDLHPLGFALDWATREKAIESIRFVLSRQAPHVMERYDRIDRLTPDEIEDLRNEIYRINQVIFSLWGLGSAINQTQVPYFGGSYIRALASVFNDPRLGFSEEGITDFRKRNRVIRYQWNQGRDVSIENIKDAIRIHRPDLLGRYEQLDLLTPGQLEALKNEIYQIGRVHLNAWGLGGGLNAKRTPYFYGSFKEALKAVFPRLGLNPLGFELDWSSREKAIESMRFILSRQAPELMRLYDRFDQLRPGEAQALKDEVYKITQGHLITWGLGAITSATSVPYFDGSYVEALRAFFPRLDLNPVGFRFDWLTEQKAIESIRFALSKEMPVVLKEYERLRQLNRGEIQALKEEIYKISHAHFRIWGLASATRQREAPYFKGSFPKALQAVFPDLELNPLGFQLDWSAKEKAVDSIRFVLAREVLTLIDRYDHLNSLTTEEKDALKEDIYQITHAHFEEWGLSAAFSQAQAPYFQGSYINALLAVFPGLDLNPLGFRLNWSSLEKGLESIRFVLSQEMPGLVARYDRLDHLTPAEIEALRNDVYEITAEDFRRWGLSNVLNDKTTAYFHRSHINALLRVFDHSKLGLTREGFLSRAEVRSSENTQAAEPAFKIFDLENKGLIWTAVPLLERRHLLQTKAGDRLILNPTLGFFMGFENRDKDYIIRDSTLKEIEQGFDGLIQRRFQKAGLVAWIRGGAEKAAQEGRPFTIVDLGAGNVRFLRDLKQLGISNLRLIGYSNVYFPGWTESRKEGIPVIYDDVSNLSAYLKPGQVDLFLSHWGALTHYEKFHGKVRDALEQNYQDREALIIQEIFPRLTSQGILLATELRGLFKRPALKTAAEINIMGSEKTHYYLVVPKFSGEAATPSRAEVRAFSIRPFQPRVNSGLRVRVGDSTHYVTSTTDLAALFKFHGIHSVSPSLRRVEIDWDENPERNQPFRHESVRLKSVGTIRRILRTMTEQNVEIERIEPKDMPGGFRFEKDLKQHFVISLYDLAAFFRFYMDQGIRQIDERTLAINFSPGTPQLVRLDDIQSLTRALSHLPRAEVRMGERFESLLGKETKTRRDWLTIFRILVRKAKSKGLKPTPRNLAAISGQKITNQDIYMAISNHGISYQEARVEKERALPKTKEDWIDYFRGLVAQLPSGTPPTPANVAQLTEGALTARGIRKILYRLEIPFQKVQMTVRVGRARERELKKFIRTIQTASDLHVIEKTQFKDYKQYEIIAPDGSVYLAGFGHYPPDQSLTSGQLNFTTLSVRFLPAEQDQEMVLILRPDDPRYPHVIRSLELHAQANRPKETAEDERRRSEAREAMAPEELELAEATGGVFPIEAREKLIRYLVALRRAYREREGAVIPDYLKEAIEEFRSRGIPMEASAKEVGAEVLIYDHLPSESETAAVIFSLARKPRSRAQMMIVSDREVPVNYLNSIREAKDIQGQAIGERFQLFQARKIGELKKEFPSFLNQLTAWISSKVSDESKEKGEGLTLAIRKRIVVTMEEGFAERLGREAPEVLNLLYYGIRRIHYQRAEQAFQYSALQTAALSLSEKDYEKLTKFEQRVLEDRGQGLFVSRYSGIEEEWQAAWITAESKILQAFAHAA